MENVISGMNLDPITTLLYLRYFLPIHKDSSRLLCLLHHKVVECITHHGIYKWLGMLPHIGTAQVESEANLMNYAFYRLGDVKIQKFCRLAGDPAGAGLIAREILLFQK